MKVAILGVGTVGSEVANILIKNKDIILARAGVSIEPVIGLVRDTSKKRDVQIPLSSDAGSIIERDDIDVFVELMGGVEKPYEIVSEILKRKKAVVTANKALQASGSSGRYAFWLRSERSGRNSDYQNPARGAKRQSYRKNNRHRKRHEQLHPYKYDAKKREI